MNFSIDTLLIIILSVCGLTMIITPLIFLNSSKNQKNTIEDSAEFEAKVKHFEVCGKMEEYRKRAVKICVLELFGLVLVFATCVVLFFAPIFRIKVELLEEELASKSFSLFDEAKLLFGYFAKDTVDSGNVPFLLDIAHTLLILIIVFLCFAGLLPFLGQCSAPLPIRGKISDAVLLAHSEEKNSSIRDVCQYTKMIVVFILVPFIVAFGVGYYFCMKNLVKADDLLGNISLAIHVAEEESAIPSTPGSVLPGISSEGILPGIPSYFPFVNSVSVLWLLLALALAAGCIGMFVFVRMQGKTLIEDLEKECLAAKNGAVETSATNP